MDVTDDYLSSNLPEQPSTSHNDEVSCSADRNSSTGHHLSMQAQSEMDISSPKFDDASSLSNPESFLLTRISLNWNVDFVNQKVFGSAKLAVLQKKSGENELFLDSRKLEIHSVHNAETGEALDFAIEAHSASEVIGQRLKIKLPHSAKESAIGTIWIVVIEYSTSPKSEALHWMPAAQTVSQKFPYVYSHCQAIHARSLFPCQDTPFVKFTYDASVKVAKDLTALMSAISVSSVQSEDGRTFVFEQKVPIPSYLVALAVGALESRDVGHRTQVWSESEAVAAAALEFAETEKYIQAAEALMGPYVWGRCDLLILPSPFPYGGMENPCLIFVTPTLLAGDTSLVDIIARGIGYHFGRDMPKRRQKKSKPIRYGSCLVTLYDGPDYANVQPARRRRTFIRNSLKRNLRNMPYLCVEAICQFLPTSDLIRLYSNAVPVSQPCWRVGVETVLRDRVRLPLSLGDDPAHQQQATCLTLFDATGAKVASVKRPRAIRSSPLGEFVESAAVTVRCSPLFCRLSDPPANHQLYIVNGDALSSLTGLSDLTLTIRDFRDAPVLRRTEDRSLLKPTLKFLAPRLESLALLISDFYLPLDLDEVLRTYSQRLPLHQLTSLRRLILPDVMFGGVMAQAADNSAVKVATRRVLSRLRTLAVLQEKQNFLQAGGSFRRDAVRFVAARCKQLSSLCVPVEGKFKPYLAAFRALTGLTTLGMDVVGWTDFAGLTFSDGEKLRSVTDLRFVSHPESNLVFQIALFFPCTTALSIQSRNNIPDALCLASSFCSTYILPNLTTLSCFHLSGFASSSSSEIVTTQFIGNPNLPETVDLSPMIFENLIQDPSLLTAIFQAMKRNWIRSLLLRGPMHREALPRLQDHITLHGESAKVSAWKVRDLDNQPGVFSVEQISDQTDFKIVGRKTAGGFRGEQFTIRVFHQLAKRRSIFE